MDSLVLHCGKIGRVLLRCLSRIKEEKEPTFHIDRRVFFHPELRLDLFLIAFDDPLELGVLSGIMIFFSPSAWSSSSFFRLAGLLADLTIFASTDSRGANQN